MVLNEYIYLFPLYYCISLRTVDTSTFYDLINLINMIKMANLLRV